MKNKDIIYISILIVFLILLIIISFETGKMIYKLTNTNLGDKSTVLKSDIAEWKFNVRVEF